MIKKKRIRKLNPYKNLLPATSDAYIAFIGVTDVNLERAGFSDDAVNGMTILPNRVGRNTMFNAEGKNIIRRDMPMETAYRTVEWHWNEWHGQDTIERSDFRDVPYKRYPREHVAPPAMEITLSRDDDGTQTVISGSIDNWRQNESLLIHTINVFLELFGECVILNSDKSIVLPTNIQHVNWKLLPKGEYPFSRIKQELQPILSRVKKGNRSFVDKRLERLNRFEPAYTVIGIGGFSGYVVMAYPDRNLYVLESLLYGNATYVLDKDWEAVSKLTKADILNQSLHKDRIIHHSNWFVKVKNLFYNNPKANG